MKRLVLTTCGGLCNRLRALTAAQLVCARLDLTLALVWQADKFCPADFGDLFVVPRELTMGDPGHDDETLRLGGEWGSTTVDRYRDRFLSETSSTEVHRQVRHFIGELRPVPAIRDKIVAVKRDWPEGIVGVHVRRTDHSRPTQQGRRYTKQLDSDVALIHRLDREPETTPFFVATDNPESDHTLCMMYEGRVRHYNKHWHHDALRKSDVADAVVDLYCLASCRRIIGTWYSSFSEYAAALGGIPLDMVDAEKYDAGVGSLSPRSRS